MDPRMFHQIESQPKLHRILVDGDEVFSSNVLLQALRQFNQTREEFGTCNVEFQSACTYEGKKK